MAYSATVWFRDNPNNSLILGPLSSESKITEWAESYRNTKGFAGFVVAKNFGACIASALDWNNNQAYAMIPNVRK